MAKRVLWFGISRAVIPLDGAPCFAVLRGSFANPFANYHQARSDFDGKATCLSHSFVSANDPKSDIAATKRFLLAPELE